VLSGRCKNLEIPYVVSGAVDSQGYYANAYYQIGMQGSYQRKNAAAAIEAAAILNRQGYSISTSAVQTGISQARWQGRMELVSEQPWVLLDGAHNVHGLCALTDSLRELLRSQPVTFFMGVMAEKDYSAMTDLILPMAKTVYTLTPASDRALPAEALCAHIRRKGGTAEAVELAQAVQIIRGMDAGERVVVFGSLYLIGDLREMLLHQDS
jgi:dihydrofolate synthase/folylpolyglutamate synthase